MLILYVIQSNHTVHGYNKSSSGIASSVAAFWHNLQLPSLWKVQFWPKELCNFLFSHIKVRCVGSFWLMWSGLAWPSVMLSTLSSMALCGCHWLWSIYSLTQLLYCLLRQPPPTPQAMTTVNTPSITYSSHHVSLPMSIMEPTGAFYWITLIINSSWKT